jgi:hypothetical protein
MNTDLEKIAHSMRTEAPVFIVGAPRSGTSILYRTLQRHSSFKPHNCQDAAGVELTESNIFKNPYDIYSGSAETVLSYMLHNQEHYQAFLGAIQPIQQRQNLLPGKQALHQAIPKIGLFKRSLRVSLWQGLQNDVLIQAYLYYAKAARGAQRIIEKTPQHIALLPEIKTTFPEAKLLFMPRHPIDVYTSYRRRHKDSVSLKVDQSTLKWLELSPSAFCKKYMGYTQLALDEVAQNSHQFHLIKYEDFIADTRSALKDILSFLQEPYEESCIPEEQTQRSDWQVDPNVFAGIKQKTKDWREFIQESEARQIEQKLAPAMAQLGYAPYSA